MYFSGTGVAFNNRRSRDAFRWDTKMFIQALKRTFVATAAAGALLAGMATAPASATPINSLFAGGNNFISDNSAEYLIKGAGNTLAGIVQAGDRLRGIA